MSATRLDVVIDNHNYGGFLGEAITSALEQSVPARAVIVVDDGSTDDSRQVIRSFGDRIEPVFKDNGGQASAMNAGFTRTAAELVLFLDSDDVLEPTVIARVQDAYAAMPAAARIHYRMGVIDGTGRPTGEVKPSPHLPLPHGDLVHQTLRAPFDAAWLPTSGNVFASTALRAIMPVPEAQYRLCADWYLVTLSALLGPVAAVNDVLAHYRVHGANGHQPTADRLDVAHLRATIGYAATTRGHLARVAALMGLEPECRAISRSDVANRLISLRVDRGRHPVPADTVPRVLADGIRAVAGPRRPHPALAALYVAWLGATALSPRALVTTLAEWQMYPSRRPRLNTVLARVGGGDRE